MKMPEKALTENEIKSFVKEVVNEIRLKEAEIAGDKKTPWGSEEHVQDLLSRIEDLKKWRDKQKRGSSARSDYARLITQLQTELRSAKRQQLKTQQA